VRLVVGTEDSGLGSGTNHLLAMLRLLALCERQAPETREISCYSEPPPLTYDSEWGYTVAVIPWSDQAAPVNKVRADRVLSATQLEELTHAY